MQLSTAYLAGQGLRAAAVMGAQSQRTATATERLIQAEAARLARMTQDQRRDYLAIKNGAVDADGAVIPHETLAQLTDRLTGAQTLGELRIQTDKVRAELQGLTERLFLRCAAWGAVGLMIGLIIGFSSHPHG